MKDISDRKSFGVEWSPVDGLKFQLINRKGTDRLTFTAYRNGRHMVTDGVDDTSRFMDVPPQDYDEFYRIACRYAAAVERNTEYARKHTVIHTADGSTRSPDENTPRERRGLLMGIF